MVLTTDRMLEGSGFESGEFNFLRVFQQFAQVIPFPILFSLRFVPVKHMYPSSRENKSYKLVKQEGIRSTASKPWDSARGVNPK